MTAQSSRFMLRLAIIVTSAAILSILANVFANAFLKISLNSTGYYIIVIALGIASSILGILQTLPKFSAFSRSNDEQQTLVTSLDYSSREKNVPPGSDSQVSPTIAEEIHSITQQQNNPVKVTMEINGTPITIESPDVGKIEDIVKHLSQDIQASNQSNTIPSQTAVREKKETYHTEDNPE